MKWSSARTGTKALSSFEGEWPCRHPEPLFDTQGALSRTEETMKGCCGLCPGYPLPTPQRFVSWGVVSLWPESGLRYANHSYTASCCVLDRISAGTELDFSAQQNGDFARLQRRSAAITAWMVTMKKERDTMLNRP